MSRPHNVTPITLTICRTCFIRRNHIIRFTYTITFLVFILARDSNKRLNKMVLPYKLIKPQSRLVVLTLYQKAFQVFIKDPG